MFNNKFNSSKSDPLVEAVKQAQHDGDLRRQAEAYVNEEFGVYSRQAVVREHLAAYDAALEEAYKSLREGKPNDGNLANNYPPYDKVTRGDVIAGRLGKDQMGGKKKMEEKKDCYEEADGLPPSEAAQKASVEQERQTPEKTPSKTGNAAGSTISNARAATGLKEAIARKRDIAKGGVTAPIEYADKMGFANPGAISKLDEAWNKLKEARKCMEEESDTFDFSHLDEAYANYIAEAINEYGLQEEHPVVTVENLHMFNESYVAAVLDEAAEREYEKAKEHEEKTKELDEARMRAEKECNEEELEEAKKWIQSAIKRPGSLSKKLGVPEEKNIPASKLEVKKGDTAQTKKQKVLAKTLKHLARKKKMDEEAQIDEVVAAADLAKSGLSLGQYMNKQRGLTAVKGGKNDPSSPSFVKPTTGRNYGPESSSTGSGATNLSQGKMTSAGKAANPVTGVRATSGPIKDPNVATGKTFSAIDKSIAKAEKKTPDVTPPSTPQAGAARDTGMTGKTGGETGVTSGSTVSLDRPGNVGARPSGAGAAGTVTDGSPKPAPAPTPAPSAPTTSQPGAPKDDASAGVKKAMAAMNESVQVGNKSYRIV